MPRPRALDDNRAFMPDVESPPAIPEPAALLPPPSVAEIWRRPLPHLAHQGATRFICRTLLTLYRRRFLGFGGGDHVTADRDPFLLAVNHSQRPEAILLPAWLCFLRGGRMVHFMADWNFQLIPGVAWIIRLHDPIHVVRKDARPRFLNRFKSRYRHLDPPFIEARRRLDAGRSVGVFPEATVNRHPGQLLRGQNGVARLALESGVPVVPGGLRFPGHAGEGPIADSAPFAVRFGSPIRSDPTASASASDVAALHARIMGAISTLSGKEWQPDARRTKYVFSTT
ncbi:MAG: 1-acyl-sn-glycerol-3-phosphate acyltransferase [Verrucomicrobiae bacterium]|nr:1-acyl-sn-glycerol-3-phosphate acyltransferase [Verrucomicrobiae bacterium]